MCLPPGAIRARPGITRSLFFASLTSIWHRPLRREANKAVNFSGICCTITMPGQTRGKAVRTISRACVPPVEVPMATIRSVVCAMECAVAAERIASALSFSDTCGNGVAALTWRLTLAWAAALTAATRSLDDSCKKLFNPTLGLVIISTAPAASACMVVSAPFSVSVEQITTGVGCSAIIFLRKVMPSMRGISTSSTITSGHSRVIFSMAKIGSDAAPIT